MRKTIYTKQAKLIQESIKRLRQEAGLTQRELCRRLGREHSFISKIELGERRVDLAEFYWICQACGVAPLKVISKLLGEFGKL